MDADSAARADSADPADVTELVEQAVELAQRWADAAGAAGAQRDEQAASEHLAALVQDQGGLELAVRFVDRVARPEDSRVAAKDLSRLRTRDSAGFLGAVDRLLFGVGSAVAPIAPGLVVPAARARLRHLVGHLVVDAQDPALAQHLAQARESGQQLNVNLLGEAVLGEAQARSRVERTADLLRRDDVDHVSIKVSSLISQVNPWDTEGTVERAVTRLRPLYRLARTREPRVFVTLDMEEYRDLDITVGVFTRLLAEPEFVDLEAGIALQAYLPDALPVLERLIAFAMQRRERGGARIKVRLVKGANLAMERAEAILHGWPPAPYETKVETDANYLRCLERVLRPDVAGDSGGLRVGLAGHNLFDLALGHLLALRRGVAQSLDVEMLQGMAPAQACVVQADVGPVLLYTPIVAPDDFDVAVAYLIRRLEENATPGNFLGALSAEGMRSSGTTDWAEQEQRFRDSVAAMPAVATGARRDGERPQIGDEFANTPDSDPAVPATRQWADESLRAPLPQVRSPELGSTDQVAEVVARGRRAATGWRDRSAADRARVLRQAARELEARRGSLIGVMAQEGGKTVAEGDPEVSEAVDFARYYADRGEELTDPAHLATDGARFEPYTLTLVAPPWNFPVAIPVGGIAAALSAGSAVVVKPSPATPRCVEMAVEAFHAAGVPEDVLQVVRTDEDDVGRALVSHPEVDAVVLTGSADTGRLFRAWRAGLAGGPGVLGETSGKNALVITPAADFDLAVADLVRSAFGHAGQKCSAASLGILVGSVGRSDRFRRQLVDAVSSLVTGPALDLGTGMGPLIGPPGDDLLRAMTSLDDDERWLVAPRRLDDAGRIWTPGVKDGVAPGSFFHRTEVFGPVLGLMHAGSLADAVELQNATGYGLTGGLHSLDEREIEIWLDRVEVGNAYVNRHITGAIVQRQPFGGWKRSVVGPGAKAGGPNYVAQFGAWMDDGLPRRIADAPSRVRTRLRDLLPLVGVRSERLWLRSAVSSDIVAWEEVFSRTTDATGLAIESNELRYRSQPVVWVRTEPGARVVEVLRLVMAGMTTGTPVRISLDAATSAHLKGMDGRDPQTSTALRFLAASVDRAETAADFVGRVHSGEVSGRIRLVGDAPTLLADLAATDATVLSGPVLANGRRELLGLLREQSISRTRHRYGHLTT